MAHGVERYILWKRDVWRSDLRRSERNLRHLFFKMQKSSWNEDVDPHRIVVLNLNVMWCGVIRVLLFSRKQRAETCSN